MSGPSFKSFVNKDEGVYVSCDYNQAEAQDLYRWAVASGIPKVIKPEKYHSTIVYSRTPVSNLEEKLSKMS